MQYKLQVTGHFVDGLVSIPSVVFSTLTHSKISLAQNPNPNNCTLNIKSILTTGTQVQELYPCLPSVNQRSHMVGKKTLSFSCLM